ncbi:DUF4377 domain-containing protein [Ideonella sp. DXS29W]|uniref:DUF4377 domain-containing protein n=1 Tax=Ideonella lacteola TaxID=2984193 RepID=A0ABU9BRT9_9BURK
MKTRIRRSTACAAAVLVTAAFLAACGGEDSREETWEVQASEQECYGESAMLCLQTRASASDAWGVHYGGIEGFSYAMGNRYQVRVRISEVSNPLADGSSERVELDAVLSQTAVARSETFEMSVTEPPSITPVDDTTYRLFNRRNLTCSPLDCAVIEAARTGGLGLLLEFDHQNSPTGPMHLLGITCSAPSATFHDICLK